MHTTGSTCNQKIKAKRFLLKFIETKGAAVEHQDILVPGQSLFQGGWHGEKVLLAVGARFQKTRLPQYSQMLRDVVLGHSGFLHDLVDAQAVFQEQTHDSYTRWFPQRFHNRNAIECRHLHGKINQY
jgi:hypothetical protein